jgi:hypothetical protein
MIVIKRTFEYLWHKFTIFKGGFKKHAPYNQGYLRISVENLWIFRGVEICKYILRKR